MQTVNKLGIYGDIEPLTDKGLKEQLSNPGVKHVEVFNATPDELQKRQALVGMPYDEALYQALNEAPVKVTAPAKKYQVSKGFKKTGAMKKTKKLSGNLKIKVTTNLTKKYLKAKNKAMNTGLTEAQLIELWGENLYNVFAEHINSDGWLTSKWADILEDEEIVKRFDDDYNDNPLFTDTYGRMYNVDWEFSTDETLIRPIKML